MRTKIVATLGPATDSLERISALIEAGVDVFRLNFSHGSHEEHAARVARIRRAAGRLRANVCILQDLRRFAPAGSRAATPWPWWPAGV